MVQLLRQVTRQMTFKSSIRSIAILCVPEQFCNWSCCMRFASRTPYWCYHLHDDHNYLNPKHTATQDIARTMTLWKEQAKSRIRHGFHIHNATEPSGWAGGTARDLNGKLPKPG
jgi:hypothetical protein